MAPLLLIDALMTSTAIHFARNSFMHKSKVPSITSRLMSASSNNNFPSYPRAAVSVVIRFHDASPSSSTSTSSTIEPVRYLLIQRGKAPNKGMWSFAGGKIESDEATMDAAKRELREETGLGDSTQHTQQWTLKWYDDGPFTCSDAIADGFHYVISQCFAEVIASSQPNIEASDDAMDAKWWSAKEVEVAESAGTVSPGVLKVLKRSELLYEKGLLK
eukprot:scaffold12430_cov137-Skeletonema_marinoi.AAC.21